MNILFISSQPYPYGMAASKRIRLFAEYLAINNTVSAWVCGRNNGLNDNTGIYNGVKWHFVKFNRLDYFLNFYKIYKILKSNLKKDKKNILMLYDGIGLTNFLFALFAKRLRYKVVTDIVEDYSVSQEQESLMRKVLIATNSIFEKKIEIFIDGIVIISKRLYHKYSEKDIKSKVVLIPISAENVNIHYNNKKHNNFFKFVYSGSYGIKDGIDILLEAYLKLIEKHINVRLVLSGKISKNISDKIKDCKSIEYIGMVPDSKYYQFLYESDILLMTRIDSEYANTGFPFKLGEYLATGNPVIATDVSDVSDYLTDKENALIAMPSSVPSLLKQMEYAVLNPDKCEEIGLKGKKIAEYYFNPAKIIKNFKDIEKD